jgi:glycosyltransferase involved in cell wall biosynthesis
MRICLFADAQSIHIQQLAPGLVELGHEVRIVTHKPAPLRGATVERFHVPEPGMANLRRWQGRLGRYLRDFLKRFDIVNIHFLSDWGFCRGSLPVEHAALIATAWGSDIIDPPGETPAPPQLVQARQTLIRRADAVTACGPTFARTVAAYANVRIDHVDVVPFGVDLDLFRPNRMKTRERGPFRVGFFKGFRAVYGPAVLIEAIPLVLRRLPDTRFDLVGDGTELAKCQELASRFGVANAIQWLPRQAHHRLPMLLSQWDLSVIPSVHEAFGVAALESAAMGVPVVASDVCGLRDTVRHEETGLLVPPGDPQALADGIVALLTDYELRTRMANAGRAMVETDYDWADLLSRWIAFYESVREGAAVMA